MIIENPILSGSAELSGSFTTNGTISGSFSGDGTNLTNIQSASFATTASYAQNAEGSGFPFTGSAEITGSLTSNDIQATNRLNIPQGTTAERHTNPTSGDLRYNTSTNKLEFYNGNIWVAFSNESIITTNTAIQNINTFQASANYLITLDQQNLLYYFNFSNTPSFLQNLENYNGPYSKEQILPILNSSMWKQTTI